ncbi:MAG: pyridoxamine 5'-phosphate oxidase family protein [bacterium]
MNFQDCIKFANENCFCHLATMDEDQPRVRMFELWFADKGGFYFHTTSTKRVIKQMHRNPKVEVCFYNKNGPANVGTMMRIAGEVEFVGDLEVRAKLLDEKPFLNALGTGESSDPMLTVFRIHTGEAYFWTMEDNMKEMKVERLKF